MLKKETKLILTIIVSLFLFSCGTTKRITQDLDLRYKTYIDDNFKNYKNIRNVLLDTLETWKEENLELSKFYAFKNHKIDSLIFFSQDSSLLITALNKKTKIKDATSDANELLVAKKIKGNWHLYFGGTYILPRSYYQDSIFTNFTWDELGCLAYRTFLKGFLKFREDGSYYINEKAFEPYRTPFGPKSELSETQKDSLIIDYINGTRQKTISDKEYKDIQESIENSVRPPEPYKNPHKKSTKIFESEAWKNRYKKK